MRLIINTAFIEGGARGKHVIIVVLPRKSAELAVKYFSLIQTLTHHWLINNQRWVKDSCTQTPPGMRKPSLLLASCYRCSNYQSCQNIATINSLRFNAIMCAISNSIQWGDPYSQKIWQLQPPLSDPLPHPLGAERNLHTQRRGSTP